jgi:hypothetical protein
MVEIHEPVRLLCVVEATPTALLSIMKQDERIDKLVRGGWVQLATLDCATSELQLFRDGKFQPYELEAKNLPVVENSLDWYRGWRDHLGYASIQQGHPQRSNFNELKLKTGPP